MNLPEKSIRIFRVDNWKPDKLEGLQNKSNQDVRSNAFKNANDNSLEETKIIIIQVVISIQRL